jgi:hypothetical protein
MVKQSMTVSWLADLCGPTTFIEPAALGGRRALCTQPTRRAKNKSVSKDIFIAACGLWPDTFMNFFLTVCVCVCVCVCKHVCVCVCVFVYARAWARALRISPLFACPKVWRACIHLSFAALFQTVSQRPHHELFHLPVNVSQPGMSWARLISSHAKYPCVQIVVPSDVGMHSVDLYPLFELPECKMCWAVLCFVCSVVLGTMALTHKSQWTHQIRMNAS